ncbi:MAG: hypothetical protein CMB55_07770 [Euryarchaeota archaeon]|nr:hypothetical protein [Euryarchaeota archaeon]|tara:strand:- start:87 stop:299 length:213 start_codon:yes stop_codon:yes gene_type:complete
MKAKKRSLLKKSNVKKASLQTEFLNTFISDIKRKLQSDDLSRSERRKLQDQLFDVEDELFQIYKRSGFEE